MLATALTTMTALEVVLFGENNVALFVVVKVPGSKSLRMLQIYHV